MPDVVGFRAKMGVIIPSTNTVVESDFSDMRIPGVTFHTGRMYIAQPVLDSDQAFERLLEQVRLLVETAIALAAIDNLGRGAAGQAVQNMNLMFGLPETAGLQFPGLFP